MFVFYGADVAIVRAWVPVAFEIIVCPKVNAHSFTPLIVERVECTAPENAYDDDDKDKPARDRHIVHGLPPIHHKTKQSAKPASKWIS